MVLPSSLVLATAPRTSTLSRKTGRTRVRNSRFIFLSRSRAVDSRFLRILSAQHGAALASTISVIAAHLLCKVHLFISLFIVLDSLGLFLRTSFFSFVSFAASPPVAVTRPERQTDEDTEKKGKNESTPATILFSFFFFLKTAACSGSVLHSVIRKVKGRIKKG